MRHLLPCGKGLSTWRAAQDSGPRYVIHDWLGPAGIPLSTYYVLVRSSLKIVVFWVRKDFYSHLVQPCLPYAVRE